MTPEMVNVRKAKNTPKTNRNHVAENVLPELGLQPERSNGAAKTLHSHCVPGLDLRRGPNGGADEHHPAEAALSVDRFGLSWLASRAPNSSPQRADRLGPTRTTRPTQIWGILRPSGSDVGHEVGAASPNPTHRSKSGPVEAASRPPSEPERRECRPTPDSERPLSGENSTDQTSRWPWTTPNMHGRKHMKSAPRRHFQGNPSRRISGPLSDAPRSRFSDPPPAGAGTPHADPREPASPRP